MLAMEIHESMMPYFLFILICANYGYVLIQLHHLLSLYRLNDPRPYTFSDDLVVDVQISCKYINNLLAKSFKLVTRTVTVSTKLST